MQAIGDRLREARMRQKIDIAEVEAATKIRAKYLRALENEEFALLPGSTFVKSFLRTYAQYLGLDPHLLVEEYRAQHEPRQQSELQPFATQAPRGRTRERQRRRLGPPGPGALIIGFVILVIAGLAVLGLTGDEGDDGSGDQAGQEEPQQSGEENGEDEAESRQRRRRAAAPAITRVRVIPEGPTYVCADDGRDNVLFEGILTEPEAFRARRVRLTLGRRAVRLTVNRRRVSVPGGSSPISYDFSRGKRKVLPEDDAPTCQ